MCIFCLEVGNVSARLKSEQSTILTVLHCAIINSRHNPHGKKTPSPHEPLLSSWSLHSSGTRCRKFPASVHIRLEYGPSPQAKIIATDAKQGLRPVLPAGFGTGFETGRLQLISPVSEKVQKTMKTCKDTYANMVSSPSRALV